MKLYISVPRCMFTHRSETPEGRCCLWRCGPKRDSYQSIRPSLWRVPHSNPEPPPFPPLRGCNARAPPGGGTRRSRKNLNSGCEHAGVAAHARTGRNARMRRSLQPSLPTKAEQAGGQVDVAAQLCNFLRPQGRQGLCATLPPRPASRPALQTQPSCRSGFQLHFIAYFRMSGVLGNGTLCNV
jgi:hypothetical protein